MADVLLTCNRHALPVSDISFSPKTLNGVQLSLSASEDHSAILRNGDTGEFIYKFVGHQAQIWGCSINLDATRCATASEDRTVGDFGIPGVENVSTYFHKIL
ncbi:hypothetical protein OROHE_024662 [Orobanche hederae]